ncbi:hypothetical protein Hanom_Chr14g01276011 [Helianthus anomalus]
MVCEWERDHDNTSVLNPIFFFQPRACTNRFLCNPKPVWFQSKKGGVVFVQIGSKGSKDLFQAVSTEGLLMRLQTGGFIWF